MKNNYFQYASGNTPPATRLLNSSTVVSAGLNADKLTIAANGSDAATCHWGTTDATVTWDVNGSTVTEATTPVAGDATGLREATCVITAAQAGPIVVSVGTDSLTITAT